MKQTILIVALVLIALPISVQAKTEKQYDQMYERCSQQAGKSGITGNNIVYTCGDNVSAAAKKDMNNFYNAFYKRIVENSSDDAAKLEASQRAWVLYRNTQCELAGRYVGSPMYSYCPMQLNIRRVQELQEMAQ